MKIAVKVSRRILTYAEAVANDVAKALGCQNSRPSYEAYLSVGKQIQQLRTIGRKTGRDLFKSKILEIGSGCGMFLCVTNKLGINCYGLSPAHGIYCRQFACAQEMLTLNGINRNRIIDAFAENIPFKSDSFDIVVCFDVLEHVKNPMPIIIEALRILKPGGHFYAFVGISCYWWEWHYAIPWIPGMRKWLAKHWVRLYGRNPEYLNDLNLITIRKMKKLIGTIEGLIVIEFTDGMSKSEIKVNEDYNQWLDDIEWIEAIEQTGIERGTYWGLKWCHFVMRQKVRKIFRRLMLFPVLEILIEKKQ